MFEYNFNACPEDIRDALETVAEEYDNGISPRLIENLVDLHTANKIQVDHTSLINFDEGTIYIKFNNITAAELVDYIFSCCWADEASMEQGEEDILRLWWD